MSLSTTELTKQPSESRLMTMEFDNKMSKTELILTMDSVTSTPSGVGAPTFDAGTVKSQSVDIMISGGTTDKKYKITMIVTTDAGQVIENEGYLKVREV